ncbi:Nramp family divalent metal transporter [Heliobacterium chlorum]|uniref:Nramp family divalent metal transporter n=1 Tax=Heliobacterium chlorum TaxID=2698 RepID=A0ABR7T5T2_HELCL|nr:Nramp family divalent metal transporter [Heliobacterium chlorum]MBC9786139.1 Nramp family divalent metal transporter [Heliobacterium chlorum]
MNWLKQQLNTKLHNPILGMKEIIKYIGPGLLVTVGFIDPGNWASNITAGSEYGYKLLWIATLSTIMLIILQHNVAHLGIVTGNCLAEAASKHLNQSLSQFVLSTAVMATISTAMAEILGGAIALRLLFNIPLKLCAVLLFAFVLWMLFSNSYRRLEKWIIGFVSIVGVSFVYELNIVGLNWGEAVKGWITPTFPEGSMPIIMAILGAVVMPHNLFLHSEIIQSREWNKADPEIIKKQLQYEFTDTLLSMGIGWAINSAMIILAASTFFQNQIQVSELEQAQQMLVPILGKSAAIVFSIALLFAGISSTTTAAIAGGSIVAGMFKEPYDIKDPHTKLGVGGILGLATLLIFAIDDPFKGLIYSQLFLSIQLPITVLLQVYLTSSKRVMGEYKNSWLHNSVLWLIGIIVSALNIMLLFSFLN